MRISIPALSVIIGYDRKNIQKIRLHGDKNLAPVPKWVYHGQIHMSDRKLPKKQRAMRSTGLIKQRNVAVCVVKSF